MLLNTPLLMLWDVSVPGGRPREGASNPCSPTYAVQFNNVRKRYSLEALNLLWHTNPSDNTTRDPRSEIGIFMYPKYCILSRPPNIYPRTIRGPWSQVGSLSSRNVSWFLHYLSLRWGTQSWAHSQGSPLWYPSRARGLQIGKRVHARMLRPNDEVPHSPPWSSFPSETQVVLGTPLYDPREGNY